MILLQDVVQMLDRSMSPAVPSQNLNPDILMQPAKDWNRCDASDRKSGASLSNERWGRTLLEP